MGSVIEENYHRLLDRIGEATVRSGRTADAVKLLGVTKTVDVDRIREAIDCGLTDIGENRVQEAAAKFPLLEGLGVEHHLIGHLQSNKAKLAVELFSCIQTVDSAALARRLDRLASELPVLIQVKLGEEETKSGVRPEDVPELIESIHALNSLKLVGLMGIPPLLPNPDQARPYFRELRQLADDSGLGEISMGMSYDFEAAIEEGATMVRIGTALFGERG